MEGRWVSVKFGAGGLCPKCNRQGGMIELKQVLGGASRPGLKPGATSRVSCQVHPSELKLRSQGLSTFFGERKTVAGEKAGEKTYDGI